MNSLPLVSAGMMIWLLFALSNATHAVSAATPQTIRFEKSDSQVFTLNGRDARMQLQVTADFPDQDSSDWTREVRYETQPAGVVRIDGSLVIPEANGTTTITATAGDQLSTSLQIQVTGMDQDIPTSFPGQVVPLFTKLGCNGGGCHGKVAGQNGFRLSLLGFEPRQDYEYLVNESRGRRVSPATPDHSLLLMKALNTSPHGGGQRLERDSHEYRILRRWIAQGLPYGEGNEPAIESIEVFPKQRRLQAGSSQQLSVLATYSDGSKEDVTRGVVFESNDPQMAEVNATGLVELGESIGDVAVMARYQGHVTVFRADIPLDSENDPWSGQDLPTPRSVVDTHVFAKLKSLGVPLAQPCDDATYLRRVTLDILGRLPTLAETETFLADPSAEKRKFLVDRLLASDQYAEYFAAKWNSILRNRRPSGGLEFATLAFHDWIRESLRENKPYDEFVRQIVSASGTVTSNPAVVWLRQVPDTNQRIEDAAQLFLGQRIQCARCHHHPYEKWSQADYAQLAAFFNTVTKKADRDPQVPVFFTPVGGASARHPKTGQSLAPAGLDGDTLSIPATDDPRAHFADWMVDPENPFFAQALVNRYWKHFMGRGLVEPEDDLRVTNPPSNPELLDGMAAEFVKSGYNLKALIRMIVTSHTYSLSSDASDENLIDRRSYARFYPKRLPAEVLLDSVDVVTGNPTRFAGMPAGVRAVALPDTAFGSYFMDVFGQPDSATACECERSGEANLAQSLHLLNSEEIQSKLSGDVGRAAKLATDPSRTADQKVSELYMIAFSRPPSDGELKEMLAYLSSRGGGREAYEDIVWTLINSKEFVFNH